MPKFASREQDLFLEILDNSCLHLSFFEGGLVIMMTKLVDCHFRIGVKLNFKAFCAYFSAMEIR